MTTSEPKLIWTKDDVGCYADGVHGHGHCREWLADLLDLALVSTESSDKELLESLRGEMPDDAWDEYEALDVLNSHTTDDCVWNFFGGNLMLVQLTEMSDD